MELVGNMQASLVNGNKFQGQVINCGLCSTESQFRVSTGTCVYEALFLPDAVGSSLGNMCHGIDLLLSISVLTSLKYW